MDKSAAEIQRLKEELMLKTALLEAKNRTTKEKPSSNDNRK